MNHASRFALTNLNALSFSYRLLAIDGLTPGDNFERNINLLKKEVDYELRQPIALVKRDNQAYLALPADCALPVLERPLTPDVAKLRPLPEVYTLDFARLDESTAPVALRILAWAFQNALWKHNELWSDRSAYFWKTPKISTLETQMFQGFRFRLAMHGSQGIALCLDFSHKYADTGWLTEMDGDYFTTYRMRHFLYHFAHQWYRIQLIGRTGQSIQEQQFVTRDGDIAYVYPYTLQKCRHEPPQSILSLDPQGPAIKYRLPGSSREQFGAAALCKLLYRTDAPVVKRLHQESILPAHERLPLIIETLANYFSDATLGGIPIQVSSAPARATHRHYPIPDLLFGQGKRLHIKRSPNDTGVSLEELGQARMKMLLGKEGGAYTTTAFGTQYEIIPTSWPTEVQDDFLGRLTTAVEAFYRQSYRPQPILYEDTGCHTTAMQMQAIREALHRKRANRGYAVLALPREADPSLHNHLKRAFWDRLQFQCAQSASILEFYQQIPTKKGSKWVVRKDRERRYASYLRYLALGVMLVNRKWPFMLADPLHYDLYIGIDVLNNAAGFTFLYPSERLCHFYHDISHQREKLDKDQVKQIIYEQLSLLSQEYHQTPRSIVFMRDGLSHSCERSGAYSALKQLQKDGRLGSDLTAGTVEVHKQSAIPQRLFNIKGRDVYNPTVGDADILNDREGFLCTTGYPFAGRGTVNPLHIRLAGDSLNLEWVMEDTLAQAMLCYSAPDRCSRLPLVLKLCDLFLQPIGSRIEKMDSVHDGEEEEDDDEWR